MKVIRDRAKSFDLDAFRARPLFAHLATIGEASPRKSLVWFLGEEGTPWMIGNRRTDTFPARLERDPRCAIGIVDFDRAQGLPQPAGLRGRAVIVDFEEGRTMVGLAVRALGREAITRRRTARQLLNQE